MRKRIMSIVLAICLVLTLVPALVFTRKTGKGNVERYYAGKDYAVDNAYTTAGKNIDDEYTYTGNDLGATYTPESTTFKVWAPTATEVSVNLYATGSDSEPEAGLIGRGELEKLMEGEKWTGVWEILLEGDFKNNYYTYTITAGKQKTTKETQDVYSVATGVNGNRSMVCDLDSTDPEGWENDSHVFVDEVTDSLVWELHIKDFSYDSASGVSKDNRGKYLAFTERGTTLNGEGNVSTGIDYLKELGVTTVQINPFYDFQTINESGSDSQYIWGYDPQNYNVPEGSYSSDPYDGNVRIKECKSMIKALHDAGISVVMNVDYNHTYSTDSCFQATVPDYYYRMTDKGAFYNGSGYGNECATERAMYRNYFIQSLLYWVNEYHVDGFCFDLMGIMDVETMNLAREALDSVDTRIITWGEGWANGDSYHATYTCTGEKFYPATQANAAKLSDRIALFNDAICDGIKGGCTSISNQGFVQGAKTSAPDIIYGVRANSSGRNKWLASAPSQCVSYASCHDNATLYDQILGSTELASYGVRESTAVKMNKLSGAIVYTSQGISFMLAGEEMCRSKDGDTNSYKSAATINKINWQNIVDYGDVVSYYRGLMQIRKNFSPLTCTDNSYRYSYIFNGNADDETNQIAYTISNDTEGEWSKMAVIFNSADTEAEVTLADKSVKDWVIIADGVSAGLDNLGEVTGSTFTVPAYSAIIAVDKASYDTTDIHNDMGKVIVNFVYEKNNKKLADSVVLQGLKGTGYDTSLRVDIPDIYEESRVVGSVNGKFSDTPVEVTYYYDDYVPESINNADFNKDGVINISDVSMMQKYFAGLEQLNDEMIERLDLNYDGNIDELDCNMLSKYLAGYNVAEGSVVVNHYYYDESGAPQKLIPSKTITGRVGTDYSTEGFKIVGYSVDETKLPDNDSRKIPYGVIREVNYYYLEARGTIKLHIKHNGSLAWAPTLWIWGSDVNGNDTDNYTPDNSAIWPGIDATDNDGDGWCDYDFTYKGVGSYNIIISNAGSTKTISYKGFVEHEMWVVIDDSKISTGEYLTFYMDNPQTNPNAPKATQITFGK